MCRTSAKSQNVPKLTAGVWVGAEDRQVHFESLYYGGGSNMALPIWGLFMQKVMADKSIGIANGEEFVAPPGWNMSLGCTGGAEDLSSGGTGSSEQEDEFFD